MKKCCKKEISLLLVLSMLLTILPVQALAAAYPDAGEDTVPGSSEGGATPYADGDVTYTVNADTNTTITVDASGVLTKCRPGDATKIEIPAEIPVEDGGTRAVTKIGDSAFAYCSGLTSMTIPDSVISIGSWAFESCWRLTSMTIPGSVTSIGKGAFSHCSGLTCVTIPTSVTSIEDNTFYSCISLSNIIIPEGITSIGSYAFDHCSILTSITIPASVESMGTGVFRSCDQLKDITISPDNTAFVIIDGALFTKDMSSLIFCLPGELGILTFPETLTSIDDYAFYCCKSLTGINIPESVSRIGDYAFWGCTELEYINLTEGLTSIGAHAFSNCNRLTSLALPGTVESVGEGAFFSCPNLEQVTINGSLSVIEQSVFSNCISLKSVQLLKPDSVIAIKGYAFSGCSRLESFEIPPNVQEIEMWAFSNCTSLRSLTIPRSVSSIAASAFSGNQLMEFSIEDGNGNYCVQDGVLFSQDQTILISFPGGNGYTTYSVPAGVTTIGSAAFAGNTSLTNINIPNNVTTMESDVFSGCINLSSVVLPESITSIPWYAFYGCKSLTYLDIPSSVKDIGCYAFENCTSLDQVDLPQGMTGIGSRAFCGCYNLSWLVIPESVTFIDHGAFSTGNTDFRLLCYPDSYAVTYAEENSIKYTVLGMSGRNLSVSLLDENGNVLQDGFTVTWYDGAGTIMGRDTILFGTDNEKVYFFEIDLNDTLSDCYEQPERQKITPIDSEKREIQLAKKAVVQTLTLSGRVKDQNGEPIQGAAVSVTPADGEAVEAVTGTDGSFRAVVPCGVLSVSVRMDGYYSKREILDLTDKTGAAYDAGTYTLSPVQVITDRVTLSVTQRRAAEESGTAIETPLSSLGAMVVSVAGKDSADFEVQGLTLLFKPGKVQAGEKITVTVTDPSGAYCAASTTVELDSSRLGSAELSMVQKGSLVLGGVSGQSANLLLFDNSGNCILTRAASPGLSSGALKAGDYTAVLLQKSELLRGVSKLNYLGAFGLKAGSDYLLENVSIADGKITRLPDCAVPALDEGRISYTVAENTGVTTNKPGGAAAGTLVMVRAAYELDSAKGVSADTLRIALPKGVDLPEGASAIIDGQVTPYTYDAAKREVTVVTAGRDKAAVWLYCTPVQSGSHSVSAYLTLSNGASQPIGAAVVRAEDAKLEVPERTGKAAGLTASGKTAPHADVTLYDNDVQVGTATANAAGSWSMSFDLAQPVYSYSYHNIYAVVKGGYLPEPITTESVLVTYDKRLNAELTKITMYNTGDHGAQETVFDFTTNGSAAPYYRMWPSRYPTFTFKAEFAGDSSKLEDVYVVTTNSAGDKTYVKMTYDEANNAWVGTHNYTSFDAAPVAVSAAYTYEFASEVHIDEEMLEAETNSFLEASKDVMAALHTELYDVYDCTELTINENSISTRLTYTDPETGDIQEFGTYSMEVAKLEDEVTEKTLTDSGFSFINDVQLWRRTEFGDTSMTQIYVDLNSRDRLTEEIDFDARPSQLTLSDAMTSPVNYGSRYGRGFLWGIFDEWGPGTLNYELIKMSEIIPNPYSLMISLEEGMFKTYEAQAIWRTRLNGNVFTLQTDLDTILYGLLEARCKDTGIRKVPDSVYQSMRMALLSMPSEIAEYEKEARKIINEALASSFLWSATSIFLEKYSAHLSKEIELGAHGMSVEVIDRISKKIVDSISVGSGIGEIVGDVMQKLTSQKSDIDQYIDGEHNKLRKRLNELADSIKASYISCGTKEEDPGNTWLESETQQSVSHPVSYIADPSGYVYEAVPSNRVEGVTATISSKEENGAAWKAENYDQINPQITGADGGYYWDVPQGNWKVSFTKDGYTPTNTEAVAKAAGYTDGWLPVPPPQLEINVGMVSNAAPAVKHAAAYTDRAEVVFSQYMNIDSVKAALSLTQDGTALGGCTVEPLNAEYDLEETTQYATRFAITSSGGELSGSITVTVDGAARNYAGTPMTGAYTSPALPVSARPTGIAAPDTVSVVLREATGIPVTLRPGVAGQKLTVESLSPALVTVSTAEVTTGADGSAEITLTGILPGSGLVRISDPASGLSKTVTVNVGTVKEVPPVVSVEPVTAVLEDGTVVTGGMTVPMGAKIRLQTQTPDAVIRYTLNDTCPCTEEALTYNTPITISGDTVLRAAAYKDGVYSETVRLELSIQSSGGGDPQPGGSVSGGSSYGISTPSSVAGGTIKVSPGSAGKGTVVTITATPDSGYKLESLTVTDSKNNVLKLTDKGGGTYTFTMPAGPVKVEASFAASGTPWVNPFTDVAEREWYYDAVRFVNENGLMDGYGNGLFGVNDDLSRAQLAQILYNREGKPSASAENCFADVAGDAWYAGAVAWAFANGVASGYGDGRFGPNDSITREQLTVMLWRYAGSPAAANKELNFSDADTASAYALEALRWAVENGILNGYGDGQLGPKGLATRAQAAQILKNYLDR